MRRGTGGRSAWARRLGGLLILVAVAHPGRRADAYVRSKTEAAKSEFFYWKQGCVPATIYSNGFENQAGGFTLDQLAKSVAAAAHAWSPDAVTCPGTTEGHPYLEIVPSLSRDGVPPAIAWDSRNSIVIRTESWSKSGRPETQYDFDALAVTTVTARGDGHIVDADIEINAVTKAWLNLDPGVQVPSSSQTDVLFYDLQNALTHEFGHFLGLDHTCFDPLSTKTRPQDDMNRPVPDCDTANAEVRMTVMYDRSPDLEISKRYLSDDDKRAVCEIYSYPQSCVVDQANDGCAVGAAGPADGAGSEARGLGALAVGALAFAAARRRARARAKG